MKRKLVLSNIDRWQAMWLIIFSSRYPREHHYGKRRYKYEYMLMVYMCYLHGCEIDTKIKKVYSQVITKIEKQVFNKKQELIHAE